MRTQIRIVAGSLRGRKLTCTVNANLRPTPQRVREALFSILGNAVPERPFVDVFAGTGVVGLEAISRGASSVTFVERDFRLIGDLERHINEFGIGEQARIARTDVYRWIERWQAPDEPVSLFLSPPFRDFEHRLDELLNVIAQLQQTRLAGFGDRPASGEQSPPGRTAGPPRVGRTPLWPQRPVDLGKKGTDNGLAATRSGSASAAPLRVAAKHREWPP